MKMVLFSDEEFINLWKAGLQNEMYLTHWLLERFAKNVFFGHFGAF